VVEEDGAFALAAALPYVKTLRVLSLQHNRMGGDGVATLVEVLCEGVRLEELDVRHNDAADDDEEEGGVIGASVRKVLQDAGFRPEQNASSPCSASSAHEQPQRVRAPGKSAAEPNVHPATSSSAKSGEWFTARVNLLGNRLGLGGLEALQTRWVGGAGGGRRGAQTQTVVELRVPPVARMAAATGL